MERKKEEKNLENKRKIKIKYVREMKMNKIKRKENWKSMQAESK